MELTGIALLLLFRSSKSKCFVSSVLAEEFHRRRGGKQTGFRAALDQFSYGLLAFFAVAERPFVDVHADKLVGKLGVHFAGELHGVVQGFFAVLEAVGDAVANSLRDLPADLRTQGAADGVAAERKRQAGFFLPPDAQIHDAVQSEFREEEL